MTTRDLQVGPMSVRKMTPSVEVDEEDDAGGERKQPSHHFNTLLVIESEM